MVFSSPVFLFLFLPLCLAAAALAAALDRIVAGKGPLRFYPGHHPVQNVVLLAFSVAFYVYGSGRDVVILFASILISWLGGLLIEHTRFRKAVLAIGIAGQLCALGWFKYANFVVAQIDGARKLVDSTAKPLPWSAVVLPIGISFFVFQGISYLIDVYRRECAARKNLLDLALFKALFPQLIAGPIVRYTDVQHAIDTRHPRLDEIAGGAVRFVYGVCKKVIVADAVAEIADAAFGMKVDELTAPVALIGAVAYTFQIYFDFSAYSDMAIGLGRMFGFQFPENFRRPLTSTSITDFWRRWHMTLSFWFRDYLYKPLGGSRGTGWRTYRNLWIVFLLSGLWHGAAWTFVIWGAAHGALLTIERVFKLHETKAPWRRAVTFVLVVATFTIFRAESFSQALSFFGHIVIPTKWGMPAEFSDLLTHKNVFFFALAFASLFIPLSFVTGPWLAGTLVAPPERPLPLARFVVVARFLVMTAGVLYASMIIASNHFSPFIYFRF